MRVGLITLLAFVSCGLPVQLGGLTGAGDEGVQEQAAPGQDELAQLPTPTITPTRTPSPLPTETPLPTPTATLVVQPTPTGTPVSAAGVKGASAPAGGGGEEATPAPPPPPVAGPQNVILNGDFEAAWPDHQGVAPNWLPFDNGQGHAGWYKDTWEKVVFDGKQAQLIEIITDQGQGNRYAGIYQTVTVVPNAEYQLTIHGLVRSEEGSAQASNWGYRLQYGIDFNGGTDWTQVTNWVELPFDDHPRTDPNATNVYNYGTFTAKVVPTGKKLTLFIRAWQKFATGLEGNYDVDGISLVGTGQTQATATPTPTPGDTPTPTPTFTPTPTSASPLPDTGGELPAEQPAVAIIWLSAGLIAILFAGAIVGLVRRRS